MSALPKIGPNRICDIRATSELPQTCTVQASGGGWVQRSAVLKPIRTFFAICAAIGCMSSEKVMPSQGDNNRITGRPPTGIASAINNRPTLLRALFKIR